MKYVYNFLEGNKDMRDILGGKGANVSQMTKLGLNVPQGFILSTEACNEYLKNNMKLNSDIVSQVNEELKKIESLTGKSFSNENKTLLLSVRSGAPISMPGMMDTILNLGLNDEIVDKFAKETKNEHFAFDCYLRLIQMFGNVVEGIPMDLFEDQLDNYLKKHNIKSEKDLSSLEIKELIELYKEVYISYNGSSFPQDINMQLFKSIEAVFKSWNNKRAVTYREINNIDNSLGTAVTVQSMVYGNYNEKSGTGVVFSRNPDTGEDQLYGEFLINAQGEDIVDGSKTPISIEKIDNYIPGTWDKLNKIAKFLEDYYLDMQDIEFTIENEELYILQTRSAQRTSMAKIKYLLDNYDEGKISIEDIVNKINVKDIENNIFNRFDTNYIEKDSVFAKGIAASNGAVTGVVCLNLKEVLKAIEDNQIPILVRSHTSPEDIESMDLSGAIVTAQGGMTSHAAVVARGMGKTCVCGVNGLLIDEESGRISFNNQSINKGDIISVDGTNGKIYVGSIPIINAKVTYEFKKLISLLTDVGKINVLANADDANMALKGIEYGAQGLGLVRTEHMFFDRNRLLDMQGMIISNQEDEKKRFLNNMETYQIDDFIELFKVVGDKPISIRLLDPPLHEFLPSTSDSINELSKKLNIDSVKLKQKVYELKEENPMLGHRGCRLAITNPEIYEMQVEAICKAIKHCNNLGVKTEVKIIIPLISELNEIKFIKNKLLNIINSHSINNIEIGVMIETPRAALISNELAKESEFFSYGTNDLTQLTYGFSRDDSQKFLPSYYNNEILNINPFISLDKNGVGELIKLSNNLGKEDKSKLKTGICGEHAGDYNSVIFANKIGLDYVSCSPKRVPIAILAAAKASLNLN